MFLFAHSNTFCSHNIVEIWTYLMIVCLWSAETCLWVLKYSSQYEGSKNKQEIFSITGRKNVQLQKTKGKSCAKPGYQFLIFGVTLTKYMSLGCV